MKTPRTHLNWFLFSAFTAVFVWMSSPSVYAESVGAATQKRYFPIPEYEARYSIYWHGIKGGESLHRLHLRPDGLYHLSTETLPSLSWVPVSFIEKADFSWENGKIHPQNYYYNIHEGKRHKVGHVTFDWTSHMVSNTETPEPWALKMPESIQDKLTHALQLRLDLAQHANEYTYTVAEYDEIKPYTFHVIAEETVKTPWKTVRALRVEHDVPLKNRKTVMWLSIEDHYLPVKVEQYRKGSKVGSGEILSYTTKIKKS